MLEFCRLPGEQSTKPSNSVRSAAKHTRGWPRHPHSLSSKVLPIFPLFLTISHRRTQRISLESSRVCFFSNHKLSEMLARVSRTAVSRACVRGYRAVVCSELLPPPPFKENSLVVKELPSIAAKKGEVVLKVKAGE